MLHDEKGNLKRHELEGNTVDRDNSSPLYLQFKLLLMKKIENGEYKVGDQIPPENMLADMFGLSRPTVRRALAELVAEGRLERTKGRGTFVKGMVPKKSTKLTILSTDQHADLIVRPLARLFCSRHPDTEIEVIDAPYESVHEHFNITFIHHAGSVDLVMVPYSLMPQYVLNGKLEVLDPYIEESQAEFREDYLTDHLGRSVIDTTCSFDIPGVGARRFGVPFQNDVYVLVYRKDLFEKYGLVPPQTLSEYREMARVLTGAKTPDGEVVPYGVALSAKHSGADFAEDFIGFLWASGGELFDEQYVPIVNSPAGKRALEFYKSLLEFAPPESIYRSVFDNVRVMRNGDVAMMMNWSSLVGSLEDPNLSKVAGKLGYALFPPMCPQVAGWELAISYDSTKKRQSFKFIEFATSADPGVAAVYREHGVLPYRPSILRNPRMRKTLPCAGVVEDAWKKGRAWGKYIENRALMEVMSLYGSHALTGMMSVDDALEKMSDSFGALIKKDLEFIRLSNGERLRRLV